VNGGGDPPRPPSFREEAFWRGAARLPESFFPLVGEKKYFLLPEEAVRYGVADEVHAATHAPREGK
jgi:hypothetical protein